MALGQPLNIIFDNSVWVTAKDGFDYSYILLLLTSHCTAVLCECVPDEDQQDDDLSHLDAAPPAVSTSGSTQIRTIRHPKMSILEYPKRLDSSHSDMDPDEFIEAGEVSHPPITNVGKAIPYECPVCSIDLLSGMALYYYLHSTHPHEKPYQCHNCGAKHNNLKELSSHHSNVHQPKTVLCMECDYTSTSKAKL